MALDLSLSAPATAVHGVPFDVSEVATGAASRLLTFTGTVTDSTNTTVSRSAQTEVTDTLAYALTCDDPTVVIEMDAAVPGLFHVTA